VSTYSDEDGNVFTNDEMRNQWSDDVASMDQDKVDEDDLHSFEGWLADMLSWGRYSEIDDEDS
jgi:hypothetical protein